MSDKQSRSKGMDDLLRQALADDLPADVAAGMRQRIRRFRAGKARVAAPSAGGSWLFRRGVWAALSILMLVAGILLQGSKSSSPLADRISEIKKAQANVEAQGR